MQKMVPVVDLAGDFTSSGAGEADRLRLASEEWGCFRIINHGVPLELMAEMKSLANHLFDLPPEIKRRNKHVIPHSGYLPPSPASPHFEALGVFDVTSSHNLENFCEELHLSPLYRNAIEKYSKAIHKVLVDLAGKMAKSMGYDNDQYCEGWACQLKVNLYSFNSKTVGSVGLPLHTDSGFLTVLQDDEDVGGIEVMDTSGEFVTVDPAPGTLLVNLGDCAAVWSNGRIRNVLHRVQCKEASKRYSIAMFYSPHKDMTIKAPKEFIDVDHPRLYAPFTYEELKVLRATHNFHAGEALNLIRVKNNNAAPSSSMNFHQALV